VKVKGLVQSYKTNTVVLAGAPTLNHSVVLSHHSSVSRRMMLDLVSV